MLIHLSHAGVFDQVVGVAIGEFTNTNDRGKGQNWESIVTEHLHSAGKPAIINLAIGHIAAPLSLPLGVQSTLDADAGTIVIDEPWRR
jgi:muramoyltetrapeptide carboxypeptidase